MHRTPTAAFVILSAAGLGLVLGACGSGDGDRSEGRYCTEVGDHLVELNTSVFAVPADIDTVVDAWQTVADHAPLAVQPEWASLVAEMRIAATVDAADQEAVQQLVDLARRNEKAADKVIDYTHRICGVTIGDVVPVTTTPPTAPPATPAPETTQATVPPTTPATTPATVPESSPGATAAPPATTG